MQDGSKNSQFVLSRAKRIGAGKGLKAVSASVTQRNLARAGYKRVGHGVTDDEKYTVSVFSQGDSGTEDIVMVNSNVFAIPRAAGGICMVVPKFPAEKMARVFPQMARQPHLLRFFLFNYFTVLRKPTRTRLLIYVFPWVGPLITGKLDGACFEVSDLRNLERNAPSKSNIRYVRGHFKNGRFVRANVLGATQEKPAV